EVSATQMQRDSYAWSPAGDRGVDHVRIDTWQFGRIVAARPQHFPLLVIAQVREACFVQLQILAPSRPKVGDYFLIRLAEIVVELFHRRVGVRTDRAPAAAVMQHAGRR